MSMDYLQAFAISAAGMAADRTRVETAAANLAQANTVQDPHGVGFQPLRVVTRAAGAAFPARLQEALGDAAAIGVQVIPTSAAPRRMHEPGHPLADADGFVRYPGVDTATEMVTLMGALRSYEANVAALTTARALALKTLEIGRGA
jgi:flagellar basal-body rod protein FlgC